MILMLVVMYVVGFGAFLAASFQSSEKGSPLWPLFWRSLIWPLDLLAVLVLSLVFLGSASGRIIWRTLRRWTNI